MEPSIEKPKRGRPRKLKLSEVMRKTRRELESIKCQVRKIMETKWIVDDPYPDKIIIKSRSSSSKYKYNIFNKCWYDENQLLKIFMNSYSSLKQESSLAQTEEPRQFDPNEILDAMNFEDNDETISFDKDIIDQETGDNVICEREKVVKESITEFNEEAFEKLPSNAQLVLKENFEALFQSDLTYQEQIYLTIQLIHLDPDINCSLSAIGNLFGISKGAISTHKQRMMHNKQPHGRPKTLTEDQLRSIILEIELLYEANNAPDIDTVIDIIYNRFCVSIKHDTLYRILRSVKSLKTYEAPVMEKIRADVPLELISQYYHSLNRTFELTNVPPCFVFNVDESGFLDFVDRKKCFIVLPKDAPDDYVIGVDRNSKRSTLIGCISLDGTRLKPVVIVPNKRVEKRLILQGYGKNNVILEYQENGFINSEIFANWAENILIPEIEKRRKETGYDGEAILLLDGCSCHTSDFFLDLCTFNNIHPVFEPPGSSDQVQALDLGIFGVQKHYKPAVLTNDEFEQQQSKEIQQIVNSWLRATHPNFVVSAFNHAGIFTVEIEKDVFVARADIEKARAVRGIEHQKCTNIFIGSKTSKIQGFQ